MDSNQKPKRPLEHPFVEMWESTRELHARFRGAPPSTQGAMNAFVSELAEFNEEVFPVEDPSNARLAEEGVDVIVTLMGVLQSRGVTLAALHQAMVTVINKNDAKTSDTHWLNPANDRILKQGRLE